MNYFCEFSRQPNNKNKKLFKFNSYKDGTKVTSININSNSLSKKLKKDIGHYTTIFNNDFNFITNNNFKIASKHLIKELKKYFRLLIKKDNPSYFIVGLGNDQIPADTLGKKVTNKIISTKNILNLYSNNLKLASVISLAPSIASINGIATADIILSLTQSYKPDLVILIDSLSCINIQYLEKTFQISSSGLTPGCEIDGTKKNKIDSAFLKTPVLTIGCPTVINLHSLKQIKQVDNKVLTTKDIEIVIRKQADIISYSLNKIIHKNLSAKEIIFLSKD